MAVRNGAFAAGVLAVTLAGTGGGTGGDGAVSSSSAAPAPTRTIVLINPNFSANATASMVELATAHARGAAKIVGVTNDGPRHC